MKAWPLRWKLALYAALLAIAATIAGAATTWMVMRYQERAALDRRLTTNARDFFRDIARAGGGRFQPDLVSLTLRDRLVEVRNAKGEVLYLSPGLREPLSSEGAREFQTREIDGRRIRIGEFTENGISVLVGADLQEITQIGRDILRGMLFAIPTVLVVIVIGGRWVAGQALAPVEDIRRAAEQITARRLDQRLPVPPTGDEIAGLAEVLNHTFERLQRSFEQSVRFSADASHHLKTPISVLRAGVEEILGDAACSLTTHSTAEGLLHSIHQLNAVAENLLLLARADAGRLELQTSEFDLSELLEGVLDDARTLAEPIGLTVEAEVAKDLPLRADRAFVGMIAQNLLANAVKYNKPGGRIRVTARAENGAVELTVGNTGAGIPQDRVSSVFDRFYRGRGDERITGSGLGLSTARELARAHGGEIALLRSDSTWTELKVCLPQVG